MTRTKGNPNHSMSGEIRTDERHRQERAAAVYCNTVYRYHFVCSDNTTFSAIASSEAGAFLVLNIERPNVEARFVDRTPVPTPSRERRVWGGTPVLLLATPVCVQCRNLFASDDGSRLCGRCRGLQACNRQHVEGCA